MTTTYAACQFIVGGKPYIFSKDATDGSANEELTNVVSSRTLGETFSAGGVISHIGPVTLNSSDSAGASTASLGGVIVDPQNNVVAQIPWVDCEQTPILPMEKCSIPVGLNYRFVITTANS